MAGMKKRTPTKSINKNELKRLLGKRIKQLRIALDMSQEAIALQSDLPTSYFSSVERGERNLTIENLIKIAEGLNIDPFELFVFDSEGDKRREEFLRKELLSYFDHASRQEQENIVSVARLLIQKKTSIAKP